MTQNSSKGILLLIFTLIIFIPEARSQDRCRIVNAKDVLPADFGRATPVEGYDYDLSPSHNSILTRFITEPEDAKLGLYQVVESGLKEKAILEHVTFARGSSWSHDETKVLLQGNLNQQLYLYNMANSELMPLEEQLTPGLEIRQVAWMPDDQGVLFAAIERPFQTTDYGFNEVFALYQMNLETLEVTPVSQPDEQVDWYFYDFLALPQTQIVYSSCSIEGEDLCYLKIARADETIAIEGDYKVLDALSDDEVLVQLKQVNDEGEAEFELFILTAKTGILSPLISILGHPDFPDSPVRLSPNKKVFTYLIDETTLMLFDLEEKSSRFIASLDHPDVGDWLPSGNELMYRTGSTVFLYHYDTASHEIIRENVQDDEATEFLWLCR